MKKITLFFLFFFFLRGEDPAQAKCPYPSSPGGTIRFLANPLPGRKLPACTQACNVRRLDCQTNCNPHQSYYDSCLQECDMSWKSCYVTCEFPTQDCYTVYFHSDDPDLK